MLSDNPMQAFTTVALTVCMGLVSAMAWLLKSLHDRYRDEVTRMHDALDESDRRRDEATNRFENKLASFEIAFSTAMSETRTALLSHSSDMGKATKGITGEMLQVRSQVQTLKEDLGTRIDRLREFAKEMEDEFEQMARSMTLTLASFEEKFGGVKKLSERIEEGFGRIIVLEEKSEKHTALFRQAAQAMNIHKEEIGKLKSRKP